MQHSDDLDLFVEEFDDDLAVEELSEGTALGTWGTFGCAGSASCPGSTAGTASTGSSMG
ncbi:thiocillin family RiPP [Streptomyces sp. 8N114]|uniref:thiocillin family RiPP n=1 Tax=Streptomyces sp. 8N114 TaxID=3457419 RepID=UPI003FCF6665